MSTVPAIFYKVWGAFGVNMKTRTAATLGYTEIAISQRVQSGGVYTVIYVQTVADLEIYVCGTDYGL